jgi:hypothetical protein
MSSMFLLSRKSITGALVILIVLLFGKYSWAQSGPSELQNNPKDLFKDSNEKALSYYSGTASISIPLYEPIPISLSYAATGIRADQLSGMVGLGWRLQAGGEVRRIQRDLADEEPNGRSDNQDRFKPNARKVDPVNFASIGSTPVENGNINQFFSSIRFAGLTLNETEGYDLAPDEFSYNVLGRAGRFYFSSAGDVVSADNIKVEMRYQRRYNAPTTTAKYAEITSFIITFDDGVKCYFSSLSTHQIGSHYTSYGSRGYSACGGYLNDTYDVVRRDDNSQFTDSWNITKIVYPDDNNAMLFEYDKSQTVDAIRRGKDVLYYYYINGNARTGYHDYRNLLGAVLNGCESNIGKARLKSITKGRFKVGFEYYTDATFTNTFGNFKLEWLSALNVLGLDGSILKKYSFVHERVTPRKQLLTEIRISDKDGRVSQGRYKFDYDRTYMPDFEYLPGNMGGTSPNVQAVDNTCGVDKFGYFNGVVSSYKSLIYLPWYVPEASFVNQPIQNDREPSAATVMAMSLTKMTYPAGGSVQYEYEPNMYSAVANASISTVRIGGGIRVKKMRIYDGVDASKDVVKTFEYTAATNAALSSGVISAEPYVTYRYISPASAKRTAFWIDMFAHESWLPTNVGYERVVERASDGSGIVYEFLTAKDYPFAQVTNNYAGIGDYALQYNLFNANGQAVGQGNSTSYRMTHRVSHPFNKLDGRFDYMRGLLKKKTYYAAAGQAVSSVSYEYSPQEIAALPTILIERIDGHTGYYNQAQPTNDSPTLHLEYDVCHDRIPFWLGMMSITNTIVGRPLLSKTTSEEYSQVSGTGTARTIIEKEYNNYGYPVKTTTHDSQGRSVVDAIKYSSDYTSSVANAEVNSLVTKNMLGKAVEVTHSVADRVVAGELYQYNNDGQPLKVYSLKVTNPMLSLPATTNDYQANVALYTLNKKYLYDAVSKNIITETEHTSIINSYLWTQAQFNAAKLQGSDISQERVAAGSTSYAATIQAGNSAVTVGTFTNNFADNGETQLLFYVSKTASAKSSPFVRLSIRHAGMIMHAEVFHSDPINGNENTRAVTLALPDGDYDIVAEMLPIPANIYQLSNSYISPVNVQVTVTPFEIRSKAFYTSFEGANTGLHIVAGGKTGSKSYVGQFALPIPYQAGTYKISYWEAPYDGSTVTGNWVLKEEVITVSATTAKTIGSASNASVIDEVRLQPANTLMSTSALENSFHHASESTVGNIITHYQYDSLGRIRAILDDNGNIVKSYEYSIAK